MTDISNLFYEKMCYEQIFHSDSLKCGGLVTGGKDEKQLFLNEAEQHKISLFPALIEFYTQAKYARLNWRIVDEKSRNGKEREAVFKEDSWIKENYLDKGYSWEAVKILLSGNLNISELKNILDIDDLKATGIYQVAEKLGMKGGDLRPIDFNEYAVACMKVEDGKLIDNIYLYTGFGGLPEALHNMNVTFEQYLELAYKAKCFNYWNLIYCLKDKVPNQELMRRFFPVIFPHLEPDLADFGIKY
ncbi:hypothetical protein [Chryseobacterium koreense]